jgi:hypothetical protein
MSTVSASQIKAARLLLGLTVGELASSANIGVATIKRFEASDGVPEHRSGNLDKVRVALEARGIEFLGDPIASPGVRLHKK